MRKIKINKQNSNIFIGESYLNISHYLPHNRCILICDQNILKHYSAFVTRFPHIVIGSGEEVKTWDTVNTITGKLLELGADRHSFILGMGGGVVCDITGFVASIYMRGVEFGFISSSLLSQTDASLGGKNGINFGKYKNIIGVFNAPQFVICDPTLLCTLPKRELRSGFGEIIKHALIEDFELFKFLHSNREKLLDLDADLMEELIYRTVSIKAAIVETDPHEKGKRKTLNFGHTLGHIIEKNSNLIHGEAISAGIMLASYLSYNFNLLPEVEVIKIRNLLQSYKLPVAISINPKIIIDNLKKDKKKDSDNICFILLESIGKSRIHSIPIRELSLLVPDLCRMSQNNIDY